MSLFNEEDSAKALYCNGLDLCRWHTRHQRGSNSRGGAALAPPTYHDLTEVINLRSKPGLDGAVVRTRDFRDGAFGRHRGNS